MNVGRLAVTWITVGLVAACGGPTEQGPPTTGPATVTVTASAASIPVTTTPSQAKTSPTSAAATATASAAWSLTVNGLGPLVIGTKISVLEAQGYVVKMTGVCEGWRASDVLEAKGVNVYPSGSGANEVLAEVSLSKTTYATQSGAKVGDTLKTLKSIYGSQLNVETKNGNGGPFKVAHVKVGAREVVFVFPWGSTLVDTDVVSYIVARQYSLDMFGEC